MGRKLYYTKKLKNPLIAYYGRITGPPKIFANPRKITFTSCSVGVTLRLYNRLRILNIHIADFLVRMLTSHVTVDTEAAVCDVIAVGTSKAGFSIANIAKVLRKVIVAVVYALAIWAWKSFGYWTFRLIEVQNDWLALAFLVARRVELDKGEIRPVWKRKIRVAVLNLVSLRWIIIIRVLLGIVKNSFCRINQSDVFE